MSFNTRQLPPTEPRAGLREETEQPDTIRAWLVGANPQLDDKAPVELLRNDEFVPAYKAAENFVDA